MNFAPKPIAMAMLVTTTQLAGVAYAQVPKARAAPVVQPAARSGSSEETQRHFTDAVAAYARKDYGAAATDIRKVASLLRLDAGRAAGEAKQELHSSVAHLDTLAASVENGAVKGERSMAKAFAKADHARFESLGNGINDLGQKIGGTKKPSPFDAGA